LLPVFSKLDSFNIDNPQEKTVGEVMVYRINARIYPGYEAMERYDVPGYLGNTFPPINPGQTCKAFAILDGGDFLCKPSGALRPLALGTPVNWEYCIVVDESGQPYGDTSCSMIFIRKWSPKPQPGIFKKIDFYEEGSLRQELIYNGKTKDAIKLQYREFRNDMARPAFYQDLSYDLTESKIIGFRGMMIEVLEATNSFIKFIVKSKMN
jgi:hypothetical protein